jgi:colicin import membrane protein
MNGNIETAPTPGTIILKPGYLISLKSHVAGGALYERQELSVEEQSTGAQRVRRWTTTQTIFDPDEWKEAKQVRGRVVSYIWNRTVYTEYGLMCPEDHLAALDEAIAKAREEVAAFNAKAKHTHVKLHVLRSRLLLEQASPLLAEETGEVLDELEAKMVAMGDKPAAEPGRAEAVKETRRAVDKMSGLATLLQPGSLAERIAAKIKQAREAANQASKEHRDATTGSAKAEAKAAKEKEKAEAKAAKEKAAAEAKAAKEKAAAEAKAAKEKAAAEAKAAKKKAAAEAKAAKKKAAKGQTAEGGGGEVRAEVER